MGEKTGQKLISIIVAAYNIEEYLPRCIESLLSQTYTNLEILIVDEALSVGDVFFQAKCYHKFEEFKQMGKTILFVSHDLSSIAKYCDRVILLNKGTKLGEGLNFCMVGAGVRDSPRQFFKFKTGRRGRRPLPNVIRRLYI